MSYLKLENIKKSYHVENQDFHVLNGINLDFNRGEFVSILGESGGGKTTLMNIIAGLDSDYEGNVIVNGQSLKHDTDKQLDEYRRDTIGFIFQNFNLVSHLSIQENVMVSLEMTSLTHEEQEQRAIELLKKVGLYDHRNKYPNQLSGGQKQRVSIARALASDPDIIIADEPTGALDAENTDEILKLMNEIAEDGKLVIAVTHSQIVADYGTRIVHLAGGLIDEDKSLKKPFPILKTKKSFQSKPAGFASIFKMAFEHFTYNLKRNILIMFGSAIGIFSVIFMLGLGNGVKGYINHEIYSQVNPSTVQVTNKRSQEQQNSGSTDGLNMTTADANRLKKISNVSDVEQGAYIQGLQLNYAGKNVIPMAGAQTSYKNAVLKKNVKSGKMPTGNDQIFLTKAIAQRLNKKNPYAMTGKKVKVVVQVPSKDGTPTILTKSLKVSGVSSDSTPTVYPTLDAVKSMYASQKLQFKPSFIALNVKGGVSNVQTVQNRIKSLKKNGKQAYSITGAGSIVSTLNTYVNIASIVLATIAAISLLVSAIMIIVVLFISVSERTKEIGILRALGYTKGNIRNLFFSESFFLGIFSSIGAVIIAFIVEFICNLASDPKIGFSLVQISPLDAISAVIVFVIICLLAALAPAAKAAKLDPVVSLSDE